MREGRQGMNQGFYVYNVTDQRIPQNPFFTHPCIENANKEAERLAMANPGKTFQVLEICGQVTNRSLQWDYPTPF
jgi:hypothetical protein